MVDAGERILKILLVEDTSGDIRLISEGFKRAGWVAQFQIVSDGEEALNVLLGEKNFDLPDLILLDLNLLLISGHEVLKQIKTNKKLQEIPVVIFTSSLLDEDIAKAKINLADFYVIKPINLNEYFESISKIKDFWRNFQKSKKKRPKNN